MDDQKHQLDNPEIARLDERRRLPRAFANNEAFLESLRNAPVEHSDELRAMMRADLHDCISTEFDEEADLYDEIMRIRPHPVRRVKTNLVADTDLDHRSPYSNCLLHWSSEPARRSQIVTGWFVGEVYIIAHAVLRNNNQLYCINPPPFIEDVFEFLPDYRLDWIRNMSGIFEPRYDGDPISKVIRTHAEFLIMNAEDSIELLDSGIDLRDALTSMFLPLR